jgi:hypothetical protein
MSVQLEVTADLPPGMLFLILSNQLLRNERVFLGVDTEIHIPMTPVLVCEFSATGPFRFTPGKSLSYD